MKEQFQRSALLIGGKAIDILSSSHVAIFGLGGVGGSAALALARAGVAHFGLIDDDVFSLSNLNRQSLSSLNEVGRAKVDVAEERLKAINEDITVIKHRLFYLPDNHGGIDFSSFDYVVDAIDTVSAKLEIAKEAKKAGVPLISALGCGNRLDPTKIKIGDIFETSGDPLARILRRELRKNGINELKVVYSTEIPLKPTSPLGEVLPPGKKSVPGSSPFVPPAAGLALAYEVCHELTHKGK
jgi:tRNA threonylcarbamoyladenosine dehydratase